MEAAKDWWKRRTDIRGPTQGYGLKYKLRRSSAEVRSKTIFYVKIIW
jgi:hypothetical protein